MERTRRMGRAAVLVVGVVCLLAACTSSGSDGAKVETASGDGCAVIEQMLLPAALLESRPSAADDLSDEEQMDALRQIAALVPEDQQEAWDQLVGVMEQAADDPQSVDEDDAMAAYETLDSSLGWAARTCPDAPPAWQCPTQSKFQSVGQAIDDDGSVDPPEGDAATPEEALAALDDADAAEELDRTDDAVLYGWLDEDGLVVRTEEIEHVGGGWTASVSRACSGGDAGMGGDDTSSDDGFEPVGEPVPGN